MDRLGRKPTKVWEPVILVRERPYTYDEYAAMPEEEGRFELLDGQLHLMSPAPTTRHQLVLRSLDKALETCEEEYIIFLAPVDVILSEQCVLQPDIVVVHQSRSDICRMRGIEGPPDLVVEILSPFSARRTAGASSTSTRVSG